MPKSGRWIQPKIQMGTVHGREGVIWGMHEMALHGNMVGFCPIRIR